MMQVMFRVKLHFNKFLEWKKGHRHKSLGTAKWLLIFHIPASSSVNRITVLQANHNRRIMSGKSCFEKLGLYTIIKSAVINQSIKQCKQASKQASKQAMQASKQASNNL